MGIEDVEPAVLVQLLEFAHRYTTQVLQDALVYADHASSRQGGSSISIDDVQLAIQSRVNYSFTQPPPKEMLLSLATSLNSVPLPPVSNRSGIRLPPPEFCLTNVNFAIVPDPPPETRFGDTIVQPATDGRPTETKENETTEDMSMVDVDGQGVGTNETHGAKRALEEDEEYD
ncbi:Similar to S.cerevisiae protein TAF9 (Subunit (17 kDa) of TFIID and SAGA complexes) [Malassezia sympodialis ATCC 42132]|uniref:Similar to S.cerevisiae protein TAF9 (Subunit (17 kDa) of TFIID and SAGA complexes) n=2 Tax=Malassezia sympodialis (strain ATCC 42132) TaxID=1230383 RepID=A0A1M8A296_MALS4|nr:Similar to S.cerevisiae protein TAF9 (Subunit (17 kDa) of TFIID and SAGA complexes) [Malassezia sympodialis ATCC 42132]